MWQTIHNSAAIASIIGAIVTIFLILEARKIRKSFIRKARLPSINNDLAEAAKVISGKLNDWEDSRDSVIEQFAKVKGILVKVREKLPPDERRQINSFLRLLQPTKGLRKAKLNDMSKSTAREAYMELCTIVEGLSQLREDTKWD